MINTSILGGLSVFLYNDVMLTPDDIQYHGFLLFLAKYHILIHSLHIQILSLFRGSFPYFLNLVFNTQNKQHRDLLLKSKQKQKKNPLVWINCDYSSFRAYFCIFYN